jgi:hypothetical protein
MNQLSRATGLKIAAVILWTMAILGIVTVGIPVLTGSRTDIDGPFFWLVIFSFAVDAITMVVAYGVWRAERWGIILAIAISAFNAVLNTMGALGDPNPGLQIMAGIFVFASLSVIYLCLRREPNTLSTTG